jgi:hypothetical protein
MLGNLAVQPQELRMKSRTSESLDEDGEVREPIVRGLQGTRPIAEVDPA